MTEGFLSRSPFPRLLESLAAAALIAAAGFVASTALAAQAEYAGPSTTPAATTPAAAKADAGGPRWNELGAAHRKVLAPLANDWDGLDARSKERWIDVAGRYPKRWRPTSSNAPTSAWASGRT